MNSFEDIEQEQRSHLKGVPGECDYILKIMEIERLDRIALALESLNECVTITGDVIAYGK